MTTQFKRMKHIKIWDLFSFFSKEDSLLSFLRVALPFVTTGQRSKVIFYRSFCFLWSVQSVKILCNASRVTYALPDMMGRFTSNKVVLKVEKKLRSALCWKATPIRESVTGLKCTWGGSETRWWLILLHSVSPAFRRLISISKLHCSHFVTNLYFGQQFWGDASKRQELWLVPQCSVKLKGCLKSI